MSDLTVKALLEQLGFPSTQSDLDESLKWALVELALRRRAPEPTAWVIGTYDRFDGREYTSREAAIEAAPGELDLQSGDTFWVRGHCEDEEVEFQDLDCDGCDAPFCDACNAEYTGDES